MDQSTAEVLLHAAMESPAVVDELWGIKGEPTSIRAQSLAARLGGNDALVSELLTKREEYLQFLRTPSRYPKALYEEALSRFPLAEPKLGYTTPEGFVRRRGLLSVVERVGMGILVKLTPPRQRIPSIVVFRAKPTSSRFPWQQADDFHQSTPAAEYTGRYVRIAGAVSYEASFHVPGDSWLEKIPMGSREEIFESQVFRVMIPLVTMGDKEHMLMFATVNQSGAEKRAFDSFVASFY